MPRNEFQTTANKATILGNRKSKPPVHPVDVRAIPIQLKRVDHWLGWQWKWNAKTNQSKGKWEKIPTDVNNDGPGSSTNPTTWCSFKNARAAQQAGKVDGIGFALGETDEGVCIAGIDLDDCRDPKTGELNELARDIVATLSTYSEVSPTGTGIKLLCYGKPQKGARTKNKGGTVEVYGSGRYFTITGQRVDATPKRVEKRQEQLAAVHAKYVASEPTAHARTTTVASCNGRAPETALSDIFAIKPDGTESDGSARLVLVARQAVLHDLDDDTAVRAIRAYEAMYPFPRSYTVEEILHRVRDAEQRAVRGAARNSEPSPPPDAQELLAEMPESVRAEARAMLESRNLMEQIKDDVAALGVAGERGLVASIYLVCVSRLLPNPLSAIVQAPTSSGKSYVVEKTASLFPLEAVISATSMTPQSLVYMPQGSLSHRIIVAGERSRSNDDKSAEATRNLREMISSGRLSRAVTISENGVLSTKMIHQEGPIAYVETTSMTKIFDEDANRCLLLSADEREEQTKAILDHLAAIACGAASVNAKEVTERHYAAQRMLQPHEVVVPFAPALASRFLTARVVARRAFPHLLSMIRASALLHQFQRMGDSEGRLIATTDDYRIVRDLCRGPLARSLGKVTSKATLDFLDRLKPFGKSKFTTAQATKKETKSPRSVQGWLKDLCQIGAVKLVGKSQGNQPAVWTLTGMDRADAAIGAFELPKVEEVCP